MKVPDALSSLKSPQESINAWQCDTFPHASDEGVVKHLREEFGEFLDAEDDAAAAEEAADMVILLYCWAMNNGVDLLRAQNAVSYH